MNRNLFKNDYILATIPPILALLVALAGGISFQPFPDAGDYMTLAANLTSGFDAGLETVEAGWRTPGYPALLWLFGWAGAAGYLLCNLFCLYGITYILLRRAGEARVSRGLLLFMLSCSAGLLALTATALSEIAFTFFLVLNIDLLLRRKLIWAALVLAVLPLIRPAALFLAPFEIGYMIIVFRPDAIRVLLFVLIAYCAVFGWAGRNYCRFGHFAFTSHAGRYVYFYKIGGAISRQADIDFELVREQLNSNLGSGDPFERDADAARLARLWITDNPGGYAKAMITDLPNFWMPDITGLFERLGVTGGNRGTLDVLRREGVWMAAKHYFTGSGWWAPVIAALYIIDYACIVFLALLGTVKLLGRRHYALFAGVALIVVYFWILPAGNLDWRFRMPVWPLLCLCAVYALKPLPSREKKA